MAAAISDELFHRILDRMVHSCADNKPLDIFQHLSPEVASEIQNRPPMDEDERKILYGDPDAPEPQGVIDCPCTEMPQMCDTSPGCECAAMLPATMTVTIEPSCSGGIEVSFQVAESLMDAPELVGDSFVVVGCDPVEEYRRLLIESDTVATAHARWEEISELLDAVWNRMTAEQRQQARKVGEELNRLDDAKMREMIVATEEAIAKAQHEAFRNGAMPTLGIDRDISTNSDQSQTSGALEADEPLVVEKKIRFREFL